MIDEDDKNHASAHELCEVIEATISAFLAVPGHESLSVEVVLQAVEMTAGVWRRLAKDNGYTAERLAAILQDAHECANAHYRDRVDGVETDGVYVEVFAGGREPSSKLDN